MNVSAPTTRDYYSLITRAVANLVISTRDTRQVLYERARTAQQNSFDPALTEPDLIREREALEQAIRRVEAETEKINSGSKRISDFVGLLGDDQY